MALAGFDFLSKKPLLVVYNIQEDGMNTSLPADILRYNEEQQLETVLICGKVEMEIAE